MTPQQLRRSVLLWAALSACAQPAGAQVVETVGSRALGMGGAFVAVATDSTATWWNPAGLAAGPFLDMSLGRAVTDHGDPGGRDTGTWFALGTPPFGFSYYRLRITNIHPARSTVTQSGSREDPRTGMPPSTLTASQVGVTLLQTVIPGLHAGATFKYVRARLEDGDPAGAFDADAGVIGVAGALRVGFLARNLRETEIDGPDGAVRLARGFRAGLAYDAEAIGGPPLIVAFDADLRRLETYWGDRRNVALGAEGWLLNRRLAVRGGARFNTVGARERAATGGVSVAVRAGLYLDGHVVRGGTGDDRGWGVAARVAF